MVQREIGDRIAKLRGDQMQEELAAQLYITREKLSMWEQGRRMLKAPDIIDLANHFRVSADYLLFGVEPEHITTHLELGISQSAIESLKQFKKLDDAFIEKDKDGTAINAGWCAPLSIALSSFEFLSTVVRILNIKPGEPGIDDSARFNVERRMYECDFSPDMYAAAMSARLSMILESLRLGAGGKLAPYAPTTEEREQSFQLLLHDLQTKGAQDGKEAR